MQIAAIAAYIMFGPSKMELLPTPVPYFAWSSVAWSCSTLCTWLWVLTFLSTGPNWTPLEVPGHRQGLPMLSVVLLVPSLDRSTHCCWWRVDAVVVYSKTVVMFGGEGKFVEKTIADTTLLHLGECAVWNIGCYMSRNIPSGKVPTSGAAAAT